MKAGALAAGAVILFLGELGAIFAQNQIGDYESLLPYTGETLGMVKSSGIFQQMTLLVDLVKYSSIVVGVTGIGLLIYGALAKEKHAGGHCKYCGAQLSLTGNKHSELKTTA